MTDQEKIEKGISFRKEIIDKYMKLVECLKKDIAAIETENAQRLEMEIRVIEITFIELPAKINDLEAYMKHSTKKSQ